MTDAPLPDPHRARLADMDAATWNGIARLRQNVFVVEQECAYPDLDARDTEPGAEHLWFLSPGGEVIATLRLLHEDAGVARRIGRVATAADHRGRGLMGALLRTGIDACEGRRIEIEAQAHLERWYAGFGFVRSGDEFLEDGIPHVPMTLPEGMTPPHRERALG